jgi:hypothetical protein
MSGWLGYVVLVGVVLMTIAPRQTLGPTFRWINRLVGPGVVAVVALSWGAYLMLRGALAPHEEWLALTCLGVGAACALWWIYRRFVPRYRDQAGEPDEPG